MSLTQEHTVFCNYCGAWERFIGSARHALRSAKKLGWRRTYFEGHARDLCPFHSKEPS